MRAARQELQTATGCLVPEAFSREYSAAKFELV